MSSFFQITNAEPDTQRISGKNQTNTHVPLLQRFQILKMFDPDSKGPNRILLVGEGNFSFTIALLKKFFSPSLTFEVISTCYQKYKELSPQIRTNAHLANKLGNSTLFFVTYSCLLIGSLTGAEIWFGVDATCLHIHERMENSSFNLIIFNFPHIGGKMKIHLNRLLLKQFFTSSSLLLAEGGSVLVTLCRGQSGTYYDSVHRKTSDTWQIIKMATYGDLILKQVIPFKAEDWPEYYCNGYRSLEKGFLVSGALTFSFSKAILDLKSLSPGKNCSKFFDFHCLHQVHHSEIQDHLLNELTHIQNYFNSQQIFFQIAKTSLMTCSCRSNENSYYWQTAILRTNLDSNLYSLQTFYDGQGLIPDQTIIFFKLPSSKTVEVLFEFVTKQCKQSTISDSDQFYSIEQFCDMNSKSTVLSIFHGPNDIRIIAIHLKEFIQMKANFPAIDLNFPPVFDWPVKSLYPPLYTHHLSFWVPKASSFSHEKFALLLRRIAGGLIRHLMLIDRFECPITHRHSVCYEIVYQSLLTALSPDKVWQLHLNVIGGFLKDQLGVEIR